MSERTRLAAFLSAVGCSKYTRVMSTLGFGVIEEFASYDDAKLESLLNALEAASVPLGFRHRIKRAVAACRASTDEGAMPQVFSFEHIRALPIILLRDELAICEAQFQGQLLVLEEERKTLTAKLAAMGKQLANVEQKRRKEQLAAQEAAQLKEKAAQLDVEAAREAAQVAQHAARREVEAAQTAQRTAEAAERAAWEAKSSCEAELREHLKAARVALEAEAERADVAETREVAEREKAISLQMRLEDREDIASGFLEMVLEARANGGLGTVGLRCTHCSGA